MKKNSTLIYLVKNYRKKDSQHLSKMNFSSEKCLERAEKGQMDPSTQTINNILGFAQSYEVIETKKNGHVEMILN